MYDAHDGSNGEEGRVQVNLIQFNDDGASSYSLCSSVATTAVEKGLIKTLRPSVCNTTQDIMTIRVRLPPVDNDGAESALRGIEMNNDTEAL